MYHRGPDGSGYELFSEDNIALGHRRLSILDLSEAGKQPMQSFNGRYWITYNGEIFNFLELRNELQTLGYQFRTNTDTEVILCAFIEWKEKCFLKFNGMWAIVIWDNLEKQLLLCRDRYGVKPLHYINTSALFAFASETIAFNYLTEFKREIDSEKFASNCLQYNVTEAENRTLYKNIYQIPAGTYGVFSLKQQTLKLTKWWYQETHLHKVPSRYEDQVESFRALFFDALKLRLRSDVNIASALSGGVDSSSIFCSINHLSNLKQASDRNPDDWQSAYVNTFPNTSYDERKYAEIVEKHTGKKVNYVVADYQNMTSEIVSSTKRFDSISGTAINCVTDIYKAMRKNGIRVSLDGHGVDELLFGYTESARLAYIDSVLFEDNAENDLESTYLNMFDPLLRNEIMDKTKAYAAQLKLAKTQIESRSALRKLMSKFKPVSNSSKLIKHDWYSASYEDKTNTLIDFKTRNADQKNWSDFFTTDIPYNLRDFDRGSMQHGIEIRMPFMDYRLVNYCFSLPTSSKIGNGYTKRILRDAMRGILPEPIRTRTFKQGLSAPMADWFNGKLNEFVKDEVNSQSFKNTTLWNGKLIADYAIAKCTSKSWDVDSANQFWIILNAHIIINK